PELLYPLSDVLSRSGEYEAARVAVSEALARLGPSPPPEQRLLYAKALNQRGNLESRLGRFDAARATLERALELGRETGDPETLGLILERLGELADYTGHPEESRERYTEAIGLYRQVFDEQHPRVLLLRSSLGVLRQAEDPEAAEAVLRQTIAEQRELFGGSHPKLAVALNNLGVLLKEQGDFAGAEDALNESLAMNLEILSASHPSYGMALGNLADVKGAVGSSSVVLVNPTHFAVAIHYERGAMAAPEVVVKGRDSAAKRMIRFAHQQHTPVVRNVKLARALYAQVDEGGAVPDELYRAVAEVLIFVYRLGEHERRQPRVWPGASPASPSASPHDSHDSHDSHDPARGPRPGHLQETTR
ncbi:MAG: EscU/YscU/HrcU family type III secretion system export apparatus switch protein, partial [Acidobacteriota bacterium]